MNEVEGFNEQLQRAGAAPAPVTFGEIWSANFAAGRLGAPSGIGGAQLEAYEDLRRAVQAAYPDRMLGELAAERGQKFGGGFVSDVFTLNTLVDGLPEEKRKELAPLQDIHARTSEKLAAIEDRQADVQAGNYGLSGNAWAFLASTLGVMRDPTVLAQQVAAGAIGGPITAVARQVGAALLTQAPLSIETQRRRREFGLEAGPLRAAEEIARTGGLAGGISLFAKGAGAAFGFLARGAARGVPTAEPRIEGYSPAQINLLAGRHVQGPPEKPGAPTAPAPPAAAPEQPDLFGPAPPITQEQVAAAKLLHDRDVVIYDQPAQVQTVAGRTVHERKVVEASSALEDGRPIARTVESVSDGAPPKTGDHTTSGGRVTVARDIDGPPPFAPSYPGQIAQWFEGAVQQLIRPTGERMTVRPMVVELRDLVASHDLEGRPIAAYPAELQPRDRSAPASRTWVVEKAARLEPELLGDSPTAGGGAPVIGPDGVVESGNGRVLLLQRAYEAHPDRVEAYQRFLRDSGYDLAPFKEPVLVRMREGDLPMAERGRLALEANVSATAGLSVRERAFADAKYLTDELMSHYGGGEVQQAQNRAFVRAFADQAVAPEERPNFIDADNELSADGARRIEAAMVARAWGEEDIVAGLYEANDPTSKSILGAFADSAPTVARLRAAVEEGRVPPESDPTGSFVQAFRLVEEARRGGPKLIDRLMQIDIERGPVPEEVISATRLYFRNDKLTIAAGRDVIAERIEAAVNRALTQEAALGDLFGEAPTATASLRSARLTGENVGELGVAGPGPVRDVKGQPQQSPVIDERTIISNKLDQFATDAEKLAHIKVLTAENEPDVIRMLAELDAQGLGTKSKTSVKEDEKITDKASRASVLKVKPWHRMEHVRDTFRFKSEIDDMRMLPQVMEFLEKSGLFEIVKRDTEKFFAPKEWGFRIVAFDLRSKKNGQLIEYYLPVREIEAVKDAQHLVFEKWRNLDLDKLTLPQRVELAADQAASQKVFAEALEAYFQRTGGSESEVRAAFSQVSTSPPSTTGVSVAKVPMETEVRSQVPSVERNAKKPSSGSQTTTTGLSASPRYADLSSGPDIPPSTPEIATPKAPGKVAEWPKEDTGTAAKGDEILVYRLASQEDLAGRNAGNAEGVASLLERIDEGGPVNAAARKSETIYAYRVTLTEDTGPYVGSVAGKETPTYPATEVDQGRVGRQANERGVVSYFFPKEGGGYQVESLGSVPLAKVREKLGTDADLAGNAKTAEAIRAAFEESKAAAPAAPAKPEKPPAPAKPEKPPAAEKLGDQTLRVEAERALADVPGGTGDVELTLVNPADGSSRKVMARQLLAEVEEDAQAAQELGSCVGVTLEAAE